MTLRIVKVEQPSYSRGRREPVWTLELDKDDMEFFRDELLEQYGRWLREHNLKDGAHRDWDAAITGALVLQDALESDADQMRMEGEL